MLCYVVNCYCHPLSLDTAGFSKVLEDLRRVCRSSCRERRSNSRFAQGTRGAGADIGAMRPATITYYSTPTTPHFMRSVSKIPSFSGFGALLLHLPAQLFSARPYNVGHLTPTPSIHGTPPVPNHLKTRILFFKNSMKSQYNALL